MKMSIRRFHFRKMLFCIYSKGRILATEKINATCEMSIVMKDLWSNTFFVAVIYKFTSSKQYSKNKIHWYSDAAKHSGEIPQPHKIQVQATQGFSGGV